MIREATATLVEGRCLTEAEAAAVNTRVTLSGAKGLPCTRFFAALRMTEATT